MSIPANPRAVVTGAGSGLGRALCAELAKRGGRIIASDIDLDAVKATVAGLGAAEAYALRCDVTKLDDVVALADEAERRLGGVDLVINNAGVAVGGRIGEIPIESWQWIVGINFWGVVHGCHVFMPRLRRQGSGHILNVASTAGLIASAKLGPYNTTKSAVVALSETLFGELVDDNIGVSVLCPTFFQTNIVNSARMHAEEQMADVVRQMMSAATIQAGEVARIALDGAARGDLYILPHRDGRILWRLKRWFPVGFYKLMPKLMALRTRRAAKAKVSAS